MKKIALLLLFLNSYVFSICNGNLLPVDLHVDKVLNSGYTLGFSSGGTYLAYGSNCASSRVYHYPNSNVFEVVTSDLYVWQQDPTYTCDDSSKEFNSTVGSCTCTGEMVTDSVGDCVCPSPKEKVGVIPCGSTSPESFVCMLPCQEGYQRHDFGLGCCPIGQMGSCLGGCCEEIDFDINTSTCKTPCLQNEYRGDDGECHSGCNICDGAEQQAEQACEAQNQYLTDFECLPNADCTNFTVNGNCVNTPTCTECEDRLIIRQNECSSLGSYLVDFDCSDNPTTCEVINYDSGECIDDDSSPLDPNYGDGSQDNNNDTNDIPDTDNSATSTTTTNTTNSDGSTSTSTGSTTFDMPDYNPALETIGDNIEDVTKATNAQTKANNQNTDYLGKKLDKIDDSINDLTEGEINIDYTPDIDLNSRFIDKIDEAIGGKWIDFEVYIKDLYIDQKDKYFNQTYVNKTCSSIPTVSFSILGSEYTIMSQAKLEEFGIITTLRSIIIFMFVISGVLVALRGD